MDSKTDFSRRPLVVFRWAALTLALLVFVNRALVGHWWWAISALAVSGVVGFYLAKSMQRNSVLLFGAWALMLSYLLVGFLSPTIDQLYASGVRPSYLGDFVVALLMLTAGFIVIMEEAGKRYSFFIVLIVPPVFFGVLLFVALSPKVIMIVLSPLAILIV